MKEVLFFLGGEPRVTVKDMGDD